MCSCDLIDWGAEDFTTSSAVRARKEHRCEECRSVIRVGETHVRVFTKWDGHVSTYRVCDGCDAWGRAFGAEQLRGCGCYGWEVGRMWESIAEFMREAREAA